MLEMRELSVALPGGATVVEGAECKVRAGQIVSLLGPSGSGKSTVVKAMLDPAALRQQGFAVSCGARTVGAEHAYVPQRGALVDHLDVAGNIELALAGGGEQRQVAHDVADWLAAVELDRALAAPGCSVAKLSGGQAQRVAIARALAAGRRLLVLDEPSVGLDPLGVRRLAALLVKQAREHDVAILVITHDLVLAAEASDVVLFLDPTQKQLVEAVPGWPGPAEPGNHEQRGRRFDELERAVERLLLQSRDTKLVGGQGGRAREWFATLRVAGAALLHTFDPRLFGPSLRVLALALLQSLIRPLLFYATVALLMGITVPYIMVHISAALRPSVMLTMIGGSYILSLAPPLSAIVFSATSGSAVNAWLGGISLRGQVVALEGLGIPPARYLWSPAWLALVVSYLVTAAVFVASMTAGGWLLFHHYEVPDALAKLTADFVAPAPERISYLWRGIWLMVAYGLSIASIVVAKGREPKERADQVTKAMTSAVMRTTLLVVLLELGSIVLLYNLTGRGS